MVVPTTAAIVPTMGAVVQATKAVVPTILEVILARIGPPIACDAPIPEAIRLRGGPCVTPLATGGARGGRADARGTSRAS